jgi:hypothetical protein
VAHDYLQAADTRLPTPVAEIQPSWQIANAASKALSSEKQTIFFIGLPESINMAQDWLPSFQTRPHKKEQKPTLNLA